MAKQKGLGRGLDALLSSDTPAASESFRELSPVQLQPGRFQPRTVMEPAAIAELADSIKAQGMIQPIVVRSVGPDRYEIIAGERRWRAAQLAGLAQVPVIVREVSDDAALAMALIENLQREDLNALDQANGIQRLIEEFGMTHQSAAEAVGRSRSTVSNLLRLLQLPQSVQALVSSGQLDMGHVRCLVTLDTPRQIEFAQKIVNEGLSVRAVEKLAARALAPAKPEKPARDADPDLQVLERELSDRFGLRADFRMTSPTTGALSFHFSSLDQLEVVLARLR